MSRPELDACDDVETLDGPIVFRSPPNWTAVGFFLALALLHLAIAFPAFWRGQAEGYMSLILGGGFLLTSGVCARTRYEIAFLPRERRIRVRHGLRRLCVERVVPFKKVHAVRLTMAAQGGPDSRHIEVICDHEDLDCPITRTPRQQALCLAVLMNVELIKVIHGDEDAIPEPEPVLRI